jgi:hypothetical protein
VIFWVQGSDVRHNVHAEDSPAVVPNTE